MDGQDFIKSVGESFLGRLSISSLQELADETTRESFEDLIHQLNADAGAIWVLEKNELDELTIAVNVGARGSSIEGAVSQRLNSGLVSKSFREEILIHDEGTFQDPEQSVAVDMELGQRTNYQIAMPFYMFGQKVGAVTVVQISTPEKPTRNEWGFDDECVVNFQHWVAVAQRLFEYARVRQG